MSEPVQPLPLVGVLLLDTRFARPPGDIGNARSFGGRVLYETVGGAGIDRVLRGDPQDPALADSFAAARDRLVARGARLVTTSCGLLVFHQERLARDCPGPFTASALWQIRLGQRQHGMVAVMGLLDGSITAAHLRAAGAEADLPVGALPADAHLLDVLRANDPGRRIDPARAEADLIAAARTLLDRAPETRALVLECTNLPPYQQALSEALDLPVYGYYDWLVAIHQGLALPDGRLPAASSTEIPA
ncbi:aspartate/glutamate racemase family protein [Pararhodobacter marinus]|uniref:aspartate/glutamate racemase family protein n=1 Tax=Pararhodobacter marinus TaxID=2184063 RepID=UPI0035159A7F